MNFKIAAAIFAALLLGAWLAGCNAAGSGQFNRIQIGMTKDQVITLLGAPDHIVTAGDEENLIYYLYDDDTARKRGYVVQLVEGRVHYSGQMLTMIVPAPAGPPAAP